MSDIKCYWQQRLEQVQHHLQILWKAQPSTIEYNVFPELESLPSNQTKLGENSTIFSTVPHYGRIYLDACDGVPLTIRVVEPSVSMASSISSSPPTVVYFHDMHTGPRSWLYLTRYCALGARVVMLDQRFCPYDLVSDEGATQAQRIEDSLLTVLVALGIAQQDAADTQAAADLAICATQPLACIGEGTGAGFALAAASILGPRVTKLAILNPYPCDIPQAYRTHATPQIYQSLHSYLRHHEPQGAHTDDLLAQLNFLDCLSFAPDVTAATLMGVGELGQTEQLSSFDALYQKLGTSHKKLVSYPRWGYERINDFEDAILQFIHFERKEHE